MNAGYVDVTVRIPADAWVADSVLGAAVTVEVDDDDPFVAGGVIIEIARRGPCVKCGKSRDEFDDGRLEAEYCSERCRSAARVARHRRGKRPTH